MVKAGTEFNLYSYFLDSGMPFGIGTKQVTKHIPCIIYRGAQVDTKSFHVPGHM